MQYKRENTFVELFMKTDRFIDDELNSLNFYINRDIVNDYDYELTIYKYEKHICTFQN
ncbi:MAG: hypothetical protein K9K76_08945 [Halanaerobiales bacterium]|nr:hypothetical protein [Halanaerobiales bacterium]